MNFPFKPLFSSILHIFPFITIKPLFLFRWSIYIDDRKDLVEEKEGSILLSKNSCLMESKYVALLKLMGSSSRLGIVECQS